MILHGTLSSVQKLTVRTYSPSNLCCSMDLSQMDLKPLRAGNQRNLSPFRILATQLTLEWEDVHTSLWLQYFKGVTYCIQTRENFGPMHMLSLAFPCSHLNRTVPQERDRCEESIREVGKRKLLFLH